MIRLHITVTGDIQGVGYRYFTQIKAVQFGITGWVKNSSDGTVEIVAVGENDNIKQFVDILHQGSPFSKVTDVTYETFEGTDPFQSFKIKY